MGPLTQTLALAWALAFAPPAEGEDDAPTEDPSRVIVIEDDGSDSATAGESLSGAELAEARGQGLADTLSTLPGVSTLGGTAGGMGKPMIRGQFGRRNMILFDGVPHEGQEWGLDHAPEVDPYAAGRITVIKGAGTTRFGPEAIGGVVLLEPVPLPRTPAVSTEVSTVGGSNPLGGGGAARVDWAPVRGRGLAMRVEGNFGRYQAARTPDYALDNTGAWTWNAGGRAGYLSDALDIEVGYRVMRSRLGICSCLRVSTPEEFQQLLGRGEPVGVEAYRADFEIERPFQEIWHHLALARVRALLGRAGELHFTYGFQYDDRKEFDSVRSNIVGPQLEFGLATHSVDLRFEHAGRELGSWTWAGSLGASGSVQRNEFDSANTLIPDYQQWSWAVYDIERLVHERVEFEVGARYGGLHRAAALSDRDWLGQSAGGRLDPGKCERLDVGGQCVHTFHTPSATLGVRAQPFAKLPGLRWRAQLDSSARIPAIDEQFMNGAAPSFPILGFGDAKIGVERSWGGESSVEFERDWLRVEAAGHVSAIDDYIYFVPEPQEGQCAPLTCTTRGPLPVFVFTPRDAFFGGGEVLVDLTMPRLPFGLSGSASWVRGLDLDRGGNLAFVPADRYTAAGRYFWPDTRVSAHGYVELNGTLVPHQGRASPDLDFAPAPPTYLLLGAAAGVEFIAPRQVFRLSASGQNLTNQRYRDYNSLLRYFADAPGWSVSLRFSATFDGALAV